MVRKVGIAAVFSQKVHTFQSRRQQCGARWVLSTFTGLWTANSHPCKCHCRDVPSNPEAKHLAETICHLTSCWFCPQHPFSPSAQLTLSPLSQNKRSTEAHTEAEELAHRGVIQHLFLQSVYKMSQDLEKVFKSARIIIVCSYWIHLRSFWVTYTPCVSWNDDLFQRLKCIGVLLFLLQFK